MRLDLGAPRNTYAEPVTAETSYISEFGLDQEECWGWLGDSGWHLDPGFPDNGYHREGYFKAPLSNAPEGHDPSVVVRVRCNWAPADYWDQEPDTEHGYVPPDATYNREPVVAVHPAETPTGDCYWIIQTTDWEAS